MMQESGDILNINDTRTLTGFESVRMLTELEPATSQSYCTSTTAETPNETELVHALEEAFKQNYLQRAHKDESIQIHPRTLNENTTAKPMRCPIVLVKHNRNTRCAQNGSRNFERNRSYNAKYTRLLFDFHEHRRITTPHRCGFETSETWLGKGDRQPYSTTSTSSKTTAESTLVQASPASDSFTTYRNSFSPTPDGRKEQLCYSKIPSNINMDVTTTNLHIPNDGEARKRFCNAASTTRAPRSSISSETICQGLANAPKQTYPLTQKGYSTARLNLLDISPETYTATECNLNEICMAQGKSAAHSPSFPEKLTNQNPISKPAIYHGASTNKLPPKPPCGYDAVQRSIKFKPVGSFAPAPNSYNTQITALNLSLRDFKDSQNTNNSANNSTRNPVSELQQVTPPDTPTKLSVLSHVESKKPGLKSQCSKPVEQENGQIQSVTIRRRNRPVAPKPDTRHTRNSRSIEGSAFKIDEPLPVRKRNDTNGIKNTHNNATRTFQIQRPATVNEIQTVPPESVKRQTLSKSPPHLLPPPTQVSTPPKTQQQLQFNSTSSWSSIILSPSTKTTSTTKKIYNSYVTSSITSPIMTSTAQQVLDYRMIGDSDANLDDIAQQPLHRIVSAIVPPVDLWKDTPDPCSCATPLRCKCLGKQCDISGATTSTFPSERTNEISSPCQCYKSPNNSSMYSNLTSKYPSEKTSGSSSPGQCDKSPDKSRSCSAMYSNFSTTTKCTTEKTKRTSSLRHDDDAPTSSSMTEVEADNSTKEHEHTKGGQVISKGSSPSKSIPKGSTMLPSGNHYKLSNVMPLVSEPPSRQRPHHCSECGVSFKRLDSFKQHQEMHANDKLTKSEISESNTTSSNSSQRDEVLHKCNMDKCDIAFTTIRGLRNHQRMHLIAKQVKRFKCPFCPLTFKYTGDVSRHARRHTGQKPYICGYCSMRFSQQTTLKNHERTHTGERPYKCPKCDKAYTQSGTRRYHIAIMHPEILSKGLYTKRKSPASRSTKESLNDATRDSKLLKSLAAKTRPTQESVTEPAFDEVSEYDEEQIV